MQHPHSRPTPFDLVFESAAENSFPAIRAALVESGQDPRDRDAFLMLREVVMLLRDLRPEEGMGEGIDQLVALLHHGYLFWSGGRITVELTPNRLSQLLSLAPAHTSDPPEYPPHYVQFPERRVWAPVIAGQSHEPLEGIFQHAAPEPGVRRVLGVFGMHPERLGFSVVEVTGFRPPALSRMDGTPLFSPTLPGAAAAGLFSIAGEEELLELGWRASDVEAPAGAVSWRA
jgi:hypothetical protein